MNFKQTILTLLSTRVHLLTRASIIALACMSAGAYAQAATSDALYQQLGGDPGLVKLMDDFMARLLADQRMYPFFKDVDQVELKHKLVLQFCEVSGGPCKAANSDMKKTHAGFDINKTNFNALVEVLQQSMDAQGIAFRVQNHLLARLAPMHREIINSP
jgi:hemoglobin